jgi:integrase
VIYYLNYLINFLQHYLKFLKKIQSEKIIDPEKQFKNQSEIMRELNQSKLQSPIILIDPTYKYRNVCAGLVKETFDLFIKNSVEFIKKPSEEFFTKKEFDLDWFSNHSEVDDSIKHRPKSSQKTLYASLLRILPKDEYYKKKMTELGIEIKNDLSNQEKNEKQEEAWKTREEIQSVYDDLYNRAKPFLNSKTEVSDKDLKNVIDLVMFALTSGLIIAPRRSMDWTELKIKNIDKEKDNYIDKNEFVFNTYKTSKNGSIQQRVPIPKTLKALLNKAIKVNQHDYLLVSTTGEKLSSIIITQRCIRQFQLK